MPIFSDVIYLIKKKNRQKFLKNNEKKKKRIYDHTLINNSHSLSN